MGLASVKRMSMISKNDQQKLLIPGWAGELNEEELKYIKGKLFADRHLRAKWGFKRGTGRLSEEKIKLVALYGVEALQNIPYFESKGPVQLRADFETVLT